MCQPMYETDPNRLLKCRRAANRAQRENQILVQIIPYLRQAGFYRLFGNHIPLM